MAELQVALQLYTVRDETERDFASTVRRVAQIGYGAVELAGYGGLTADELKALLEETGLRAASSHVALDRLEADLDSEITYCKQIGCSYVVLPWLDMSRRSAEFLHALAPRLNEFGRRCQEQGLAFAYHNHDFEFVQDNGVYLLDHLVESTDPALVSLELDVYWAAFAGVDPVEYLRRHAGRVALVHVKDLAADRSFTEVGNGTLDFPAIVAAGETGGARWYIVENDKPQIPSLESARQSLDYLRGIGKA